MAIDFKKKCLPWQRTVCGGVWLDEEVLFDFDPKTKAIETLCALCYPVFPQLYPLELKGIAV